MSTDSASVLTIAPATSSGGAKVIGNTDVTVLNGIASFTGITFINTPGSSNVAYTVTSSNINYANILLAFNLTEA